MLRRQLVDSQSVLTHVLRRAVQVAHLALLALVVGVQPRLASLQYRALRAEPLRLLREGVVFVDERDELRLMSDPPPLQLFVLLRRRVRLLVHALDGRLERAEVLAVVAVALVLIELQVEPPDVLDALVDLIRASFDFQLVLFNRPRLVLETRVQSLHRLLQRRDVRLRVERVDAHFRDVVLQVRHRRLRGFDVLSRGARRSDGLIRALLHGALLAEVTQHALVDRSAVLARPPERVVRVLLLRLERFRALPRRVERRLGLLERRRELLVLRGEHLFPRAALFEILRQRLRFLLNLAQYRAHLLVLRLRLAYVLLVPLRLALHRAPRLRLVP
mmetsp:Transcript_13029/g.46836  ORF Transcript_13029/g.46836 Transcript_13029/m.46836 type:complete len:332 (+) Transcript_13029:854-1849(+)